MTSSHPTNTCWICGNPVDLRTSKTDEQGFAVHEECYVAKMMLESGSQSLNELATKSNS